MSPQQCVRVFIQCASPQHACSLQCLQCLSPVLPQKHVSPHSVFPDSVSAHSVSPHNATPDQGERSTPRPCKLFISITISYFLCHEQWSWPWKERNALNQLRPYPLALTRYRYMLREGHLYATALSKGENGSARPSVRRTAGTRPPSSAAPSDRQTCSMTPNQWTRRTARGRGRQKP